MPAALHTYDGRVTYYERIGVRYSASRRPDPRIADVIGSALGDSASVVNVGAGTGSYEPTDRRVVAVEPSRVMLAQRAPGTAPAVQAAAEGLPFPDDAFDAAGGADVAPLVGSDQRPGGASSGGE
jgi:hypothetical protein